MSAAALAVCPAGGFGRSRRQGYPRWAVLALVAVVSAVAPLGGVARAAVRVPDQVEVAVKPGGKAFYVWTRDGQGLVKARQGFADGRFSPRQALSGVGGRQVQVALDAGGNAYYTWNEPDASVCTLCSAVKARRRSADGSLGALQDVSGPTQVTGANSALAVDPAGNAFFNWESDISQRATAAGRKWRADGTWSGVERFALTLTGGYRDVAVDSQGGAWLTWTRWDGGGNTAVQTVRWGADELFSSFRDLSFRGRDATQSSVATDAQGNALFVWTRNDANRQPMVQFRSHMANGTWSDTQDVSAPGLDSCCGDEVNGPPQLAVNPQGDAIIYWLRGARGGPQGRVQARWRAADGAFGPVQDIAAWDSTHSGCLGRVAMDRAGKAYFTWRLDNLIQTRTRSPNGHLSVPQDLSDEGDCAPLVRVPDASPVVGVTPGGTAVYAWINDGRVQTRRRAPDGTLSGTTRIAP